MAHVSNAKKKIVSDFVKLIKEYPIVGAVNVENLPTKQLQKMRETLRGKVVILGGKRRLMQIAIDQAKGDKKGVEAIIPHLKGMPALIFTKDNPFALFKILKKNKSNAPIKGGQVAPNDIIVPAGPTGFAPGPVIGELGAMGVAAGIENGKVSIKKDSLAAKEGEVITAKKAALLTRLGIEPMEIGLDLTAAYDNGDIFTKKVLNIDEDEFIANITNNHRWAFNLAMESGILTTETTPLMIAKAFTQTKALAISQAILAKEVVPDVLAKAHTGMLSVASTLTDDAKSESLKNATSAVQVAAPAPSTTEEKKDDPKKEEKSEENAAAGLGALFG